MAHSSRMIKSYQEISEDAHAAALHRAQREALHGRSPTSISSPAKPQALYTPADDSPQQPEKQDMAASIVASTSSQDGIPEPCLVEEMNEESERTPSYRGTTYAPSRIPMRSLSNKVRVYSDEANMDEGDSRRGSENIEDQVEYNRHPTKPRLSEQERQTVANFVKAQGQDLAKQVDEQRRRQLEEQGIHHPPSPDNIAKYEMDEMRRIIEEKKPRESEEYFKNIPTESEGDSSPEKILRRKKHHHHHHHHRPNHNLLDSIIDQTDQGLHTAYDTSSSHRASSLEINGDLINSIATEDPSKVLDWLRGYGGTEPEKRIVLSEDRILSLLHALREGVGSANAGSLQEESWVPIEKLREAERRSSAAEEQIRYFERLLHTGEGTEGGADEEQQLRVVLMKSKTMDRHFAHMKKFAEDRHMDLKRTYSNVSDKDMKTRRASISPSRSGLVSVEKARKDLQELENHKKRLVQVYSNYNDLLQLVKVEHARRVDAENKTFQLTSQLRRQTATLKRAEKVIKHTALSSPVLFCESTSSRAPHTDNLDRNLTQAASASYIDNSGRQSPSLSPPTTPTALSLLRPSFDNSHVDYDESDVALLHPKSTIDSGKVGTRTSSNPAPTPGHHTISKQLAYDVALNHHPPAAKDVSPSWPRAHTSSDLVRETHRQEFQELETALIEEGRSKGFADVDVYSEKKTVGKEETRWEYRHVHFDFAKANQLPTVHADEQGPASSVSSRDALDLDSVSNLPKSRRTASPGRSEGSLSTEEKQDGSEDDRHLLSSIAAYREGVERVYSNKEESNQLVPSSLPLTLDSCRGPGAASSARKPDDDVFSEESGNSPAANSPAPDSTYEKVEHPTCADGAGNDVADDAELASIWVDASQERFDDMAGNTVRSKSPSNGTRSDMPAHHVHVHHVSLRQLQNGHLSSKQAKTDATSAVGRCVAAMEAGHVARELHRQMKGRRRLLLLQVLLYAAALVWGVFPSSLHSGPPPT